MKNTMSRILIENTVKRTIKSIKNDPKRSIRNVVDMALQFSEGRFQQHFFTDAQTILQNENSAYYSLVTDTVNFVDEARLLTFGMNLGYNSCTHGARIIREKESHFNCNIPWTICLHIDGNSMPERSEILHQRVLEGEVLGIYTWMFFAQSSPNKILPFFSKHPDCAFALFCRPEDITTAFLEEVSEIYNLMLVLQYKEDLTQLCAQMQSMGLLYSFFSYYSQKDTEDIVNGELFCSSQHLHPVFHVLVPKLDCPPYISRLTHQVMEQSRKEQLYSLIPWELHGDNQRIDQIISDDNIDLCFDSQGNLYRYIEEYKKEHFNLYDQELAAIFKAACPKTQIIL